MTSRTPFTVLVWRGHRTGADDLDRAVQTLRNQLAPQLDWPVTVTPRGRIELPGAPYDTYREYLETFERKTDVRNGAVTVCLYQHGFYRQGLTDVVRGLTGRTPTVATPREAFPYAGYYSGQLTPTTSPHAVVNTAMRFPWIPLTSLFENFVVHETLHPVLGASNAPDGGNDHSYGTIAGGKATPMLTGYVETLSPNQPPASACDTDTSPAANRHTTTLSRCTIREAERYLNEHFGE